MKSAEIIGFCESVLELMQSQADTLQAHGVTIAGLQAELQVQTDAALTGNNEQDSARVLLRTKTAESNRLNKLAYDSASTKLDTMIGALGKNTPLGKQAKRLRSSLLRTTRSKSVKKTTKTA